MPSSVLTPILERRSRRHQVRFLDEQGIVRISEGFIANHGLQVRYGPFAGLRYKPAAAQNRILIPKLLGTYEHELHSIVAQIQKAGYDTIVDVGCAEGYYATGFALTTSANVVAFDAEKHELNLAREMAEENGLADRIEFRQWCSPDSLMELAIRPGRMFVLSDCEGYEIELFTPEVIQRLKHADVLIELHGNVKDELVRRFAGSHATQILVYAAETRRSMPELNVFSEGDRKLALNEFRGPQEWLWARTKARN